MKYKTIAKFLTTALFVTGISPVLAQEDAETRNEIQYFRHYDKRGINVFESPVEDDTPFKGVAVRVGGHFAQQFQSLEHSHSDMAAADTSRPGLKRISSGFNLATANLNLDVQLEDGVRMNLITYLSSRHHPEAWVKGGYIQFDKLPFFNNETVDKIMVPLTIKIGHMEINYGDAHFRRSDNGNAMYNPFVGNNIMDAFTTEAGGEVYYRKSGLIAMVGLTEGKIKPDVSTVDHGWSTYAKLGYDNDAEEGFRWRLTGSIYTTARSSFNTLYGGDRGGSRYYYVMEDQAADAASNFTSGRINPGFRNEVTAFMVNPFLKYNGFELFGTFEMASGKNTGETDTRSATQIAVDVLYRFGTDEKLFVGGKYNTVTGDFAGFTNASGDPLETSVTRFQGGLGWFLTKNILAKLEYVNQDYVDYPTGHWFDEGNFNGIMFEAVIGF